MKQEKYSQVIGADHLVICNQRTRLDYSYKSIPSLRRSFTENTELLLCVDLFSGYLIAKASSSRSAPTIGENYKACVFRRFGASEEIRYDREPGFTSDFFRAFNRIARQKQ